MDIRLEEHTIKEVFEGYEDNDESGVVGYGGRLNIRPAYQREFVYKEQERNAVIDTVLKGFPLNVMYWVEDDAGHYELMDGQQRTVSICQYCSGDFSVLIDGAPKTFHNLTAHEKEQFLNYRLMIYVCRGNDKEKLEWFKTINIAGLRLTDQELRNAIYTGPWLTDAKRYFSKRGCAAHGLAEKYMNGEMIRQAYLETAISWIAAREEGGIEAYMSAHQQDSNASSLWLYFNNVITWVQTIFTVYRREMKGIAWGLLYNRYGDLPLDPKTIEKRTAALMADPEVTGKKGIYEYLLSGEEKLLSLRRFEEEDKRTAYERQKGVCPLCKQYFEYEKMHADHITPWHAGGKTIPENLQMLCRDCNLKKSGAE